MPNDTNTYYAALAAEGYKDGPQYVSPWAPPGDASNTSRLCPVLRSLSQRGIRKVYEVGVGDGHVVRLLYDKGYTVVGGCDVSPEMLAAARDVKLPVPLSLAEFADATTLPPIHWSDERHYCAVISLGVLPHVLDTKRALLNFRSLAPAGTVYYLEFRNELFAFTTFNKYTWLLLKKIWREAGEAGGLERGQSLYEVAKRCAMDEPRHEPAIRREFHNEYELTPLLGECGFGAPVYHYYHAHPGLPWLGDCSDERWKKASIAMEQPDSPWARFYCSACIVEVEAV